MNVLWICSDQQRFDTLGCTGNPFVHTPNLDRLAEEGLLFEHCYSQSPLCTPSRAGFLTGRYPRTTRDRQNGQSIPEDEVLITRLLAENGYCCGLSGKLHLSACNRKHCPDMERRINDGYEVFHWCHHPDPHWTGNEYAKWLEENGQTYHRESFRDSKYVQTTMPGEYHQTTWCVERAMDFIEARQRDGRPWLFSVNLFDPHHPFDPPEEYLLPYMDRLAEIPLPDYVPGELDNKPMWQASDHRGAYHNPGYMAYSEMSDDDHRLIRAAYWAMVDQIDFQVGRLLAALEASGQREETLVIFTSDHGEMLGDHGIYLKGPLLYDCAIHVPLIVSLPGRIAPGRSQALVELDDLAPTVLEAAGMERPAGMQAKSLWNLACGVERDEHRDDVYCEYYNGFTYRDAQLTMVRTRKHKMVVCHGTDPGELYDLEADPSETHNRWDDPAYGDVKLEMMRRVCDRMAWTVDPLPVRHGNW
jgi:arylsulfatase